MERPITFQDNPEHQAGQTSSIGGLWPPESGSFNRVKAVDIRGIHSTSESIAQFLEEFEYQKRNSDSGISRIQFRGVFEAQVLHRLSTLPIMHEYVEAVIPLEPGSFGSVHPTLVYLGSNKEERLPDQADIRRIQANILAVSDLDRREISEIFSKPSINGYEVGILHDKSQKEVDEFAILYERFGWTKDEVVELLQNPNNIFSVARLHGQIISAGIAEVARIPIGNNILRMAEITEAATLSGHDGQGLYTAVSASLLIELAKISRERKLDGPIDLVFGECNGLSQGVLKVAKIQGRTLATEVGGQYGFPNSGILKQQVPIGGAERNTPYNDLVPAFLTTSKLTEYYG